MPTIHFESFKNYKFTWACIALGVAISDRFYQYFPFISFKNNRENSYENKSWAHVWFSILFVSIIAQTKKCVSACNIMFHYVYFTFALLDITSWSQFSYYAFCSNNQDINLCHSRQRSECDLVCFLRFLSIALLLILIDHMFKAGWFT